MEPTAPPPAYGEDFQSPADGQPGPPEIVVDEKALPGYLDFRGDWTPYEKHLVSQDILLNTSLVTEDDQKTLLLDLAPKFEPLPFICVEHKYVKPYFRNLQVEFLKPESWDIIKRVLDYGFQEPYPDVLNVNALDMLASSSILPHMQSPRCQGETMLVINLISQVVVRLMYIHDPKKIVNFWIPAKGVYFIKKRAKYSFLHGIPPVRRSFFKGVNVMRERRVSISIRK